MFGQDEGKISNVILYEIAMYLTEMLYQKFIQKMYIITAEVAGNRKNAWILITTCLAKHTFDHPHRQSVYFVFGGSSKMHEQCQSGRRVLPVLDIVAILQC